MDSFTKGVVCVCIVVAMLILAIMLLIAAGDRRGHVERLAYTEGTIELLQGYDRCAVLAVAEFDFIEDVVVLRCQ